MCAFARLLTIVTVLMSVGVACSKSDTRCEPITLGAETPLAAAGQASCPPSIAFNGTVYVPSCESVPARLVGGYLRFEGPQGVTYSASPIKGIPEDEAIALQIVVSANSGPTPVNPDCEGRWRLALREGLKTHESDRITHYVRSQTGSD